MYASAGRPDRRIDRMTRDPRLVRPLPALSGVDGRSATRSMALSRHRVGWTARAHHRPHDAVPPPPRPPARRSVAAALRRPARSPRARRSRRPSSRGATRATTRTPRSAAAAKAVADAHPDIASRFSIGKSYQGRELWAMKISDNVGDGRGRARGPVRRRPPRRRAHGRRDGAQDHALARRRLRHRHPDHEHRQRPRDLDRLPGQPGRRRVRHRRRQVPLLAQEPPADARAPSYIGTDLNRNYGYSWGGGGRTSSNPAAITYRGPKAFSAPGDPRDARLPGQPRHRRPPADPGRTSRSTRPAAW